MIEVVTPDLQRVSPGERFYPFDVSPDHVGLDEYDVANQGLVSHHLWPEGDAWRKSSIPFRYVWPAELDLMARLAGMTAPRALAGLGSLAVHEREPQARLRLDSRGIAARRRERLSSVHPQTELARRSAPGCASVQECYMNRRMLGARAAVGYRSNRQDGEM